MSVEIPRLLAPGLRARLLRPTATRVRPSLLRLDAVLAAIATAQAESSLPHRQAQDLATRIGDSCLFFSGDGESTPSSAGHPIQRVKRYPC